MSGKHISFVIPHKGRELFLQETIKSIVQQDYDVSLIEIIVVSQNSVLSAKTYSYQQQVALSIFIQPETDTISYLRNFGVLRSQGKYLAFLDADIYLSNNWIQSMLATLNGDSSRVIVSGSQKNSNEPNPLEQIRTALSTSRTDSKVDFLPGCNMFLLREVFQRLGGFPEHLVSCEDYYFSDRASNIGELYRTSSATYIHLGEDKNYKEMFKKEIWRGQSNLQSLKGRRIKLTELPSLFIPVGFFSLLICFLVFSYFNYYLLALISIFFAVSVILIYSLRLFRLTKKSVRFVESIKFYLFYFPARAIGTIGGAFKTFTTRHQS